MSEFSPWPFAYATVLFTFMKDTRYQKTHTNGSLIIEKVSIRQEVVVHGLITNETEQYHPSGLLVRQLNVQFEEVMNY